MIHFVIAPYIWNNFMVLNKNNSNNNSSGDDDDEDDDGDDDIHTIRSELFFQQQDSLRLL